VERRKASAPDFWARSRDPTQTGGNACWRGADSGRLRLSALRLPLLFFCPFGRPVREQVFLAKLGRKQKRAARTGNVCFTLPWSGLEREGRNGDCVMRMRTFPGRLTREEWLKLSVQERCLLAARAQSDLLELWRTCSKKPCRRARTCLGDERCRSRPWQADLNNPNRNRPDFKFSYQFPDVLRIPSAIVDQLPYLPEPPTPEAYLQHCAVEAGTDAQAALRCVFRLRRGRKAAANK
jgi:hypothetical protein